MKNEQEIERAILEMGDQADKAHVGRTYKRVPVAMIGRAALEGSAEGVIIGLREEYKIIRTAGKVSLVVGGAAAIFVPPAAVGAGILAFFSTQMAGTYALMARSIVNDLPRGKVDAVKKSRLVAFIVGSWKHGQV